MGTYTLWMYKVMEDKNSMLYWWPKVKDLSIPQPKTIMLKVDPKMAYEVEDGGKYPQMDEFKEAVTILGLPVFIRTDQLSGKHEWSKTCFLNSYAEKDLQQHIWALTDATLGCDVMGRPVNAFAFREYIPMASKYTAFFGQMPVNPERRYFIENGKVLCHHPYWIKEAIVNPSVKNWSKLSDKMNEETTGEIVLLMGYALRVADVMNGFWSVDFCKARDGRWILIDMALGESSWHPEECQNNRTVEIDYMKMFAEKLARVSNA